MLRRTHRRTFVAIVVLSALAAAPIPASAQAPPNTASTLEARLERLAAELERNRIDQHAPGAAVAVVREGKLIFARGFGLANVADKTPVTPETRFFIGSTTKAFTATLVGMLVDQGVMRWDDPADRHLPYFKLAVDSDDPAARATLRDLLSHRTGFPRMSMLLANGVLSPEGIASAGLAGRAVLPVSPAVPLQQRTVLGGRVGGGRGCGASLGRVDAFADPQSARNDEHRAVGPPRKRAIDNAIRGLPPRQRSATTIPPGGFERPNGPDGV